MNKTSLLKLAKKLNIPHRNCMKIKEELEEAIKDTITMRFFLVCTPPPVWGAWRNFESSRSLSKNIYDQNLMEDTIRKLTWEGLQKNIVMDGDAMIDKRTDEVLDLEVDSTYWKNKF